MKCVHLREGLAAGPHLLLYPPAPYWIYQTAKGAEQSQLPPVCALTLKVDLLEMICWFKKLHVCVYVPMYTCLICSGLIFVHGVNPVSLSEFCLYFHSQMLNGWL